jgi:hypothetical protein
MPYIDSDEPPPMPKTKSLTPAKIQAAWSKGGVTFQVAGVGTLIALATTIITYLKEPDPIVKMEIENIKDSITDINSAVKENGDKIGGVKDTVIKHGETLRHMSEQVTEINRVVQNPYRKRVRNDPNND